MQRRDLLKLAALAGAAETANRGQSPNAPDRMKAGTQGYADPAGLKMLAAFGIRHICGNLPSPKMDANWSVEALQKTREHVESFGLKLEMLPLPLSSLSIEKVEFPNIMLGRSPERDREIDWIREMIRNCAGAGIPSLKYNLSILGVVRIEPTEGRGRARYSTFDYDKGVQDPPLTAAGRVTEDVAWERIAYFLDRVVPVAEEYKVKIACHPHDPGMPKGRGYRGVERVLGSVDGLKRFVSIRESPYHGLNFCQGTVSEMLKRPGEEIFDVIRYFGSSRKIFNVHFRNIRGGFLKFQETFPDDGDVNMVRAIRTYREVGYDGMLMPDHFPAMPAGASGDPVSFALGYIRALVQMIETDGA
jgi:mannonate dehydratase